MYRVKAVIGDVCAGGPLDPSRDLTIFSSHQTDTSFFYLTIRTTQTPDSALFQNLRQLVTSVDPRVPLYLIRPYVDVVQEASQTVRLTTRITTWYAMAAVVIGCVGVYAAAMSRVLQQRKEFGIRLALGGLPWRVWRGVARRYVVMALTGLVIGLPCGAFTCAQLQHLLLGVSASSASLYLMTAAVISTCLALALLPAAIAIHHIKPLELLRDASA
jgi:ABC-type antimicrobial peptide transport system permease subunit